VTKDGVTVLTP